MVDAVTYPPPQPRCGREHHCLSPSNPLPGDPLASPSSLPITDVVFCPHHLSYKWRHTSASFSTMYLCFSRVAKPSSALLMAGHHLPCDTPLMGLQALDSLGRLWTKPQPFAHELCVDVYFQFTPFLISIIINIEHLYTCVLISLPCTIFVDVSVQILCLFSLGCLFSYH